MISIKRFLELRRRGSEPEGDAVEALTQMGRLLLDAMATHMVRGNDADFKSFRATLHGLARQMDAPQSSMSLLGISSDAVEALETYCQRTADYLREQNEERRSMVAMLTETVADLSGQTDASVAGLQAIERQMERASELDDIRALKTTLGASLLALREAAARQRNSSAATVDRLRAQIATAEMRVAGGPPHSSDTSEVGDLMPEPCDPSPEANSTAYVAAFRLQRADHIASRFGEPVKSRMLSMIGAQLKTVLGPGDRLLRWKGTSFVMFLNSAASVQEIRANLLSAVGRTNQQYIEVGSKSVLLSVGVDWIVFPQAGRPLEAVFTEVDAFLTKGKAALSPALAMR